jgi:hypothetical protein
MQRSDEIRNSFNRTDEGERGTENGVQVAEREQGTECGPRECVAAICGGGGAAQDGLTPVGI